MESPSNQSAHPFRTPALRRWAAVLGPLALGAVLALILAQQRTLPARGDGAEEARTVSVVPVEAHSVVPRAVGYGEAEPGDVWRAVAEVDGRVVERHPQLEVGSILPAGTLLVRIDPTDFEIRLREAEAAIRAAAARLDALTTQHRTTGDALAIEHRSLEVARTELERRRRLVAGKALADSALDQQRRTVLQQERAVQTLESELAAIPPERARLQAERDRALAQRDRARRDIDHSRITLPFDARVAAVNVEETQYVTPGQVLVEIDGIAVTEVPAQFSLDRFRALLDPAVPVGPFDSRVLGTYLKDQGLGAVVRLAAGGPPVTWEGRVDRLTAGLDPRTRTVGVVVAVDDPYAGASPPENPPLVRNMYVAVELYGRPRPGTLVIPRAALHGDRVYRVDEESRLEMVTVEPGYPVGDFVTIATGLAAGDTVLSADLVPAIEGTLLDPVVDEGLAARLKRTVTARP